MEFIDLRVHAYRGAKPSYQGLFTRSNDASTKRTILLSKYM